MQPVAERGTADDAAQPDLAGQAALREPAPAESAATVAVSSQQPTDLRSPPRDTNAAEAASGEGVTAGMGSAGTADGDDAAEEPAEDLRACLFNLLQRKCPELRITCNALGMLEALLDQVLQRVLAEALQQPEAASGGDQEPLTSLAIQKAVKQLLPNEQLPAAALKNSWHLDKQSLRGIKRRRAGQVGEGLDQ